MRLDLPIRSCAASPDIRAKNDHTVPIHKQIVLVVYNLSLSVVENSDTISSSEYTMRRAIGKWTTIGWRFITLQYKEDKNNNGLMNSTLSILICKKKATHKDIDIKHKSSLIYFIAPLAFRCFFCKMELVCKVIRFIKFIKNDEPLAFYL